MPVRFSQTWILDNRSAKGNTVNARNNYQCQDEYCKMLQHGFPNSPRNTVSKNTLNHRDIRLSLSIWANTSRAPSCHNTPVLSFLTKRTGLRIQSEIVTKNEGGAENPVPTTYTRTDTMIYSNANMTNQLAQSDLRTSWSSRRGLG